MPFPDILMCSTETDIPYYNNITDAGGRNMTFTHIPVTNSSLPMYRDLCDPHPWLTIFSTEERFVNVTQNEDGIFWFELQPQTNAEINKALSL
ncbi:hypothetical protein BGZ82_007468 [Podila clonocystis]|nr:hypothetical protein BGZ82_007468 [Podila clonocystis]